MESTRILFARVGWCEAYENPSLDPPIGGGRYTKTNIGYEAFNFKAIDGRYYG